MIFIQMILNIISHKYTNVPRWTIIFMACLGGVFTNWPVTKDKTQFVSVLVMLAKLKLLLHILEIKHCVCDYIVDILTSTKQIFRVCYTAFVLFTYEGIDELIFNPCPAELFQWNFSSFEAGIANAISSFKWRKIWLFMKNEHVW